MTERLVVITGGSSGIGAACADRFHSDGDEVVVADVSSDPPVDVTDAGALDAFFDDLPRAPDVLVNSAGVNDGGRLLDLDPAMWHRVLDVNLSAAFLCIQRAGRAMRAAGTGGVIVNVNSINADIPMRTHAPYCVSKAGLTMLTKIAAMELADLGVRVLGIAPGITDTPLAAGIMSRPEIRAEVDRHTALQGAMGTPAAIADVVHFLASDAAAWMTGETVVVDGGQQLLGLPDVARLLSRKRDTS